MKLWVKLSFVCTLVFWIGEASAFGQVATDDSLQSLIDRASPNEVIVLERQTYEEAIHIDKPMTLIGDDETVIKGTGEKPAIHIEGEGVHVENIIIDARDNEARSAILVEGENHTLNKLTIITQNQGISFQHAHDSTITHSAITRTKTAEFSSSMTDRIGNGIDVYHSHRNELKNNRISGVNDGIYIEASENNVVTENDVTNSRYAYHLMFTSGTLLQNNRATNNVTGAMVMGTEGTKVLENRLSHHQGHVHAQGMLLYDVKGAIVQDNEVTENLFGMVVENTMDSIISNNTFIGNYIGVQLQSSENNTMVENDFIQQVVPARSMDTKQNDVKRNFWEGHAGLDMTGDGLSDLPYSADPIFQAVLQHRPAFQLFADSPGFAWMTEMFAQNKEGVFQDAAPALQPFHQTERHEVQVVSFTTYMILFVCIGIAIIPFFIGGRKT